MSVQKLIAPLSGRILRLEDVPDPTFAEKMMGDGIAIEPNEGEVVAPVDGEIVQVFPTKHAVGLRTTEGLEILIHVGIDSVQMDGEGFEVHVKAGDSVRAGDRLLTFSLELLRTKAASAITPIVVTNSDAVDAIEWNSEEQQATKGKTELLTVHVKQNKSEKKKKTKGDYTEEAKRIVEAVGGEENIIAATHCVTRLRFALKDDAHVDRDALDEMDVVQGQFLTNGQYQVIIGQGTVDKVYKAIVSDTNIEEASKDEVKQASGKKQNVIQRGVRVLADIFIPILPAIVTAGLLMGLNNILANPGIFGEQSVVEMFPQWADFADIVHLIANTAFTFLPALIGWSAVKRFGGSELLGIVLGLILVHPDLLNAWAYGEAQAAGDVPTWTIFGLEIEQIGYQGQVLPVLFASWILAKIEIFLRKRVLDSLQLLVVAPIALLVTGFLTFLFIGPVTFTLGNLLTDGLVTVFDQLEIVGGLVYGAVYAPLVITGMHHTFLAVDLQLIGTLGFTFLWPILALSNIAQGSAALAVMLATKDEKLKGLAGTSGLSAYLGITEPAMFGVNLRFRYPFVAAVIGSAIAAAWITSQNVVANSVGVGGVPGFLSITSSGWIAFFIGMAIVIVVPFTITYLLAKRKGFEE
ncbi:PTS system trehalose-specific EIIBC component [Geomicrobium sp. JSM 1781026]|uniref:PTS system trehalose-specific EIIBC component n=1 Tax=Geomicrobium sp. JSM 1781026 TaxID=3344580 RepID=UPI0035C22F2A